MPPDYITGHETKYVNIMITLNGKLGAQQKQQVKKRLIFEVTREKVPDVIKQK